MELQAVRAGASAARVLAGERLKVARRGSWQRWPRSFASRATSRPMQLKKTQMPRSRHRRAAEVQLDLVRSQICPAPKAGEPLKLAPLCIPLQR